MTVQEGDVIKATGNHSWKGREGVVDLCEVIEGDTYVHATMDNGEKIIMRPGQYKVVRHAGEANPKTHADRLTPEILNHVRRVANNHRYTVAIRRQVLENVQAEIKTMLTMLEYEEHSENDPAALGRE